MEKLDLTELSILINGIDFTVNGLVEFVNQNYVDDNAKEDINYGHCFIIEQLNKMRQMVKDESERRDKIATGAITKEQADKREVA